MWTTGIKRPRAAPSKLFKNKRYTFTYIILRYMVGPPHATGFTPEHFWSPQNRGGRRFAAGVAVRLTSAASGVALRFSSFVPRVE
eukprot:4501992-Prymnesium_polylepis.1